MVSYEKKIQNIKDLNFPFEFFKGQKVVLALMDGREFKGVLLKHNVYDVDLVTNIGTKEEPQKGTLNVHKSEIKYIIENHKGVRRTKKSK